MIKSFRCKKTQQLAEGYQVADFVNFESVARRKLRMLSAAVKLDDLRSPPVNRLEKLSGNRIGQHSIRINKQFRVCFIWNDGACHVEITDYH